jgi:hypothetical protein
MSPPGYDTLFGLAVLCTELYYILWIFSLGLICNTTFFVVDALLRYRMLG